MAVPMLGLIYGMHWDKDESQLDQPGELLPS